MERQRRNNNEERTKEDDTNKNDRRITKNGRWRYRDSIKYGGGGKYRQVRRNKGKAIPIICPELSRRLRLPDCKTTGIYPHKIFLVRISFRVLSRPQDHSTVGRVKSIITPTTPSGFEIATCRLVRQDLNQLRHRFRPVRWHTERKFKEGRGGPGSKSTVSTNYTHSIHVATARADG